MPLRYLNTFFAADFIVFVAMFHEEEPNPYASFLIILISLKKRFWISELPYFALSFLRLG